MTETALDRYDNTTKALGALLKSQLQAYKTLLPEHVTPERLARLALEASSRNPNLLKCTPESITKAMIDCARTGLEPVGKGGMWLVPFRNKGKLEVQAITDYRGEMTLAYRSGIVKDIRPRAVFESDKFEYVEGDDERIIHKPDLDADRFDESALTHVYCIVHLTTGGVVRKVLNRKGVERYRKKSKAKDAGPWKTDYVAMALKTVILRAMNEVPQSNEQRAGLVSYQQHFANETAREAGSPDPFPVFADEPVIIDVQNEGPGEPKRSASAKKIMEEAKKVAEPDPDAPAGEAQVKQLREMAERHGQKDWLDGVVGNEIGKDWFELTLGEVRNLKESVAQRATKEA